MISPVRKRYPSLFDELLGNNFQIWSDDRNPIPLDISNCPTAVVIRAEVPGVAKSDIQLDFHDGILSISVKRNALPEDSEESQNYTLQEIRCGVFSRQISIGRQVDFDGVNASLDSGILTIRLPKSKEASPRRIEIG